MKYALLGLIVFAAYCHASRKFDLIECASYEDKTEQAACVAEFEARRARINLQPTHAKKSKGLALLGHA